MRVFDTARLRGESAEAGLAYLEFLRVPALSMGIYRLPAGGEDRQNPHNEDEAYYVLSGRARFQSGSADVEAGPGAIFYVPAGEPHRFHSITEDLDLLVFFAPAES